MNGGRSRVLKCSWWILVVALAPGGCRSAMGEGVHDYHVGRYPEAMKALLEAEPDARDVAPERRARYALYRGLTHLALGDRESAARWLAEAKAFDDRNPQELSDAEHGRLIAAWQALGRERGEWGWQALEHGGWEGGT